MRGMAPASCLFCRARPEDMQQQLQGAFVLGNQRIAAQDIAFAILQPVEIATRAKARCQ